MESKGVIECPQCLRRFTRGAEGEMDAVLDDDALASAAPPSAPPSAARTMPAPEVGAVGQYLLKGWTMLADHCPQCFSPLMREPGSGTMWCVQCNVQAITEEQFDAAKVTANSEFFASV